MIIVNVCTPDHTMPMTWAPAAILRYRLELRGPRGWSVAVRLVPDPVKQVNGFATQLPGVECHDHSCLPWPDRARKLQAYAQCSTSPARHDMLRQQEAHLGQPMTVAGRT